MDKTKLQELAGIVTEETFGGTPGDVESLASRVEYHVLVEALALQVEEQGRDPKEVQRDFYSALQRLRAGARQ